MFLVLGLLASLDDMTILFIIFVNYGIIHAHTNIKCFKYACNDLLRALVCPNPGGLTCSLGTGNLVGILLGDLVR